MMKNRPPRIYVKRTTTLEERDPKAAFPAPENNPPRPSPSWSGMTTMKISKRQTIVNRTRRTVPKTPIVRLRFDLGLRR
jgi:hypothetical protein